MSAAVLAADVSLGGFARGGTFSRDAVANLSVSPLSRGLSLGETCLMQYPEPSAQLHRAEGARQGEGALVGLQHSASLCGDAVVALYERCRT